MLRLKISGDLCDIYQTTIYMLHRSLHTGGIFCIIITWFIPSRQADVVISLAVVCVSTTQRSTLAPPISSLIGCCLPHRIHPSPSHGPSPASKQGKPSLRRIQGRIQGRILRSKSLDSIELLSESHVSNHDNYNVIVGAILCIFD